MLPDDLAARGIEPGAQVRIRSAIAELRTEVLADADLMPGVVSLPHGFGHGRAGSKQQLADALAGVSYNDLSDPAALDGPTGNAALNGLSVRSEEHTSELQSLMRISYAVFCLKKKKK